MSLDRGGRHDDLTLVAPAVPVLGLQTAMPSIKVVPKEDSSRQGFLEVLMSSVLASAPPRTTAVRPSRLTPAPGCGGTTSPIRQSALSSRVTSAITFRTDASVTLCPFELTTTWIADEAFWPKCSCASSRTSTDSEPLLCRPTPDSTEVTCGAKAPSTPTTSSQPISTCPKCPAVQAPSRPSGPGRPGGGASGARFGAWDDV